MPFYLILLVPKTDSLSLEMRLFLHLYIRLASILSMHTTRAVGVGWSPPFPQLSDFSEIHQTNEKIVPETLLYSSPPIARNEVRT